MTYRTDHTAAEPAIYDTPVWLEGLTENEGPASDLVTAAVEGSQQVLLSPYIFEEVRETFESSRAPRVTTHEHLVDFATIVTGSENVQMPPDGAVELMAVHETRESGFAQALGAVTDCQPKNAPVMAFGVEAANEGTDVTIYTIDEAFGACSVPEVDPGGSLSIVSVESTEN